MPERVWQFLDRHITSVEQLELLFLLESEPGTPFTPRRRPRVGHAMSTSVTFIAGATGALSGVAALYFGRFWRLSRDRFFAFFAVAFALFAVNRIALMSVDREHNAWVYVFRLAGFVLILIGIVDKNRPRRG